MDELLCSEKTNSLYPDYKENITSMELKDLHVVKAEYVGDISLNIFFSDGTSRTIDFRPYITSHPHPQYDRYLEPKYFKKFTIEHGNVVWGKNWDLIFPIEKLYKGIL